MRSFHSVNVFDVCGQLRRDTILIVSNLVACLGYFAVEGLGGMSPKFF